MVLHCIGLIRLVRVVKYIRCSLVISENVGRLPGRQEIIRTHLTKSAFSAFIIMAVHWPTFVTLALFRFTASAFPAAFLVMRQPEKLIFPVTLNNKLSAEVQNIPVQKEGENAMFV